MKHFICITIILFVSLKVYSQKVLIGTSKDRSSFPGGDIFEYDIATNNIVKKTSFSFDEVPYNNIILASNGKIYGTLKDEDSFPRDAIYEYDATTQSITSKINFNSNEIATGNLVEVNGKIYGTTEDNGSFDKGNIYEYDIATNTITNRLDFNFDEQPYGNIILASNGKIYGTLKDVGSIPIDIIFEYDISTHTVTHREYFSFDEKANGKLIEVNGDIYGTFKDASSFKIGEIFKYDIFLDTITSRSFSFDEEPYDNIILASNGKIYGTLKDLSSFEIGQIYEYDITLDSITNIKSFSFDQKPNGDLIELNGNVYGTFEDESSFHIGEIFKFDIAQDTIISRSFSFDEDPYSNIVLASNGKIYGGLKDLTSFDIGIIYEYDLLKDSVSNRESVGFDTRPAGNLIEVCIKPQENLISQSLNVCHGSQINIIANSTNADTYVWKKNGVILNGQQGDTLVISVTDFSDSGYYSLTLSNVCGQTIIDSIKVNINGIDSITYLDTICEGEFYVFNNQSIDTSGVYFDTLLNTNGCDSIIKLELTINPVFHQTIYDTICKGNSLLFGGLSRSISGNYYDTLSTIKVCDSIIELELFVTPPPVAVIYDTICQGNDFSFNGVLLISTGTYYDTVSTSIGCDSIIELKLFVTPPPVAVIYDTICQGSNLSFNGELLVSSGTFYDTLSTSLGCDSIIELELYVNPPSITNIYDTICQGSDLLFNGSLLTSSGSYYQTVSTTYGCDSTIELNLFVVDSASIIENNGMLQATPGLEGYGWYFNGDTSILSTASTISPTIDGVYTVVTLSLGNCMDTVNYNYQFSSIVENSEVIFTIYPNPTNDLFTIDFGNQNASFNIQIMDALGKTVKQFNSTKNQEIIDLSNYRNGVYFVRIDNTIVRVIKQ